MPVGSRLAGTAQLALEEHSPEKVAVARLKGWDFAT